MAMISLLYAIEEVKNDHRQKDEKWTEQIAVKKDEVDVVIIDDFAQRNVVFEEIIQFFCHIENDGNGQYKTQNKEKGLQEFSNDIEVNLLHQIFCRTF
jgi:hypothetical protein